MEEQLHKGMSRLRKYFLLYLVGILLALALEALAPASALYALAAVALVLLIASYVYGVAGYLAVGRSGIRGSSYARATGIYMVVGLVAALLLAGTAAMVAASRLLAANPSYLYSLNAASLSAVNYTLPQPTLQELIPAVEPAAEIVTVGFGALAAAFYVLQGLSLMALSVHTSSGRLRAAASLSAALAALQVVIAASAVALLPSAISYELGASSGASAIAALAALALASAALELAIALAAYSGLRAGQRGV